MKIHRGREGEYDWLCAADAVECDSLFAVLKRVPQIVAGFHVAIVAFDCGPISPSEAEAAAGWHREGDALWTSRIITPDQLPTAGYDEWYVFPRPIPNLKLDRFVNDHAHALYDPEAVLREHPTWDRVFLRKRARDRSLFWEQLRLAAPTSYISQGSFLNFATRQAGLSDLVEEALIAVNTA